jgi:hypothetical protein
VGQRVSGVPGAVEGQYEPHRDALASAQLAQLPWPELKQGDRPLLRRRAPPGPLTSDSTVPGITSSSCRDESGHRSRPTLPRAPRRWQLAPRKDEVETVDHGGVRQSLSERGNR